MMYLVCCVPVSPVRAEPSHRSEMVSQVLFGEAAEVLEKKDDEWVRIRCVYDQYEGWARLHSFTEIPEQVAKSPAHLTADWENEITINGQLMRIPFGCDLRGLQNGNAEWGKYSWSFKGNHLDPHHTKPNEKNIRKLSSIIINTGYL